jgi:hypothetical protein
MERMPASSTPASHCNYVYNSRQESNGSEDNNNLNSLTYFKYIVHPITGMATTRLLVKSELRGGWKGDCHDGEEGGGGGWGNLVIPHI